MNIEFGQIYAEIETDFYFAATLLAYLEGRLDALHKKLLYYEKKYGNSDYTLAFIISATRKNTEMQARGPTVLRKSPTIEFVLYIPYQEFGDFEEAIEYALKQVAIGIVQVFERYKTPTDGVIEAIDEVIAMVKRNPQHYAPKHHRSSRSSMT